MSASAVRVTEDGTTIISEELLKLASGTFEVSIIQSLNLSNLRIRTVQAFERCESLHTLDMSRNELATFGPAAAPTASSSEPPIPSSTTILTTSNIAPPAPAIGRPLAAMAATLRFLDLSYNQLESIAALSQFRRLESLKLHGNRLDSLEADVVAPLQGLPALKVLTLQMWSYPNSATVSGDGEPTIVATNPLCTSTPRGEYVRVMAATFGARLRCLDGHYFNKELEDPFIRPNAVDDAFANWQPPPHRAWLSEAQLRIGTSVGGNPSADPSLVGQAAEKMLNAALADAKKTVEAALASA